jgi:hypothetical protein
LLPGTSYTEQGKTVSINRVGDEAIRFFGIDNQAFRDHFHVQQVCDILVEYHNGALAVLLFVELKGGALATAEQQIRRAIQAIRSCLKGVWLQRALIISTGAKANVAAGIQKRLKRDTNVTAFIKSLPKGTWSLRQPDYLNPA